MIPIHLSPNPSAATSDMKFQCPITGLEFNGKYGFFALRGCGHVLSVKALKEVRTSACLVCHKEFLELDKLVINGCAEELAVLREKTLTLLYLRDSIHAETKLCRKFFQLSCPKSTTPAVALRVNADPNEDTGISIQNCSLVTSLELASSTFKVRTYLGRPWKLYATVVYIELFLDTLVDPAGWSKWSGERAELGLDTLYYGEYLNMGPGAATGSRVEWAGHHLMDYHEASSFLVSEFIYGDEWLGSTSFPYDSGI